MAMESGQLATEIVPTGSDATGSQRFLVRVGRRLPDFVQFVKLRHLKRGFHYLVSNTLYMAALLLPPALLLLLIDNEEALWALWERPYPVELPAAVVVLLSAAAAGAVVAQRLRRTPVYLVDFACFKPPEELVFSRSDFLAHSLKTGLFDEPSLEFQSRIMERSGVGERTYFSAGIVASPPRLNMAEARAEAEMVMFGALDELFAKTGVGPRDVDAVVVNCSLFNPTPSLSAMIVNHYRMRQDVVTFNLGGMGCSAGVVAVDVAADLLRARPGRIRRVVVVSTENITLNWYQGVRRSMLLPNCLFRMGAAAALLCRDTHRGAAKLELLHTARTHDGGRDRRSYQCVFQEEDEHGRRGLGISKELMHIAGRALAANLTELGPRVLPLSEQLLFAASLLAQRLRGGSTSSYYVPDFKVAFEHFCVHAGGRAVMDEVQRSLRLEDADLEASRMTLQRWGNTSSSSIWYEMAYLEAKGRLRRGHRVWQVAFGSGFKCNSAVWRALRDVPVPVKHNPWLDCIHQYPVPVPSFAATA